MRRHLSTLLFTVSVVLCVTTCAFWVRSYWLDDWIGVRLGGDGQQPIYGGVHVSSEAGALWIDARRYVWSPVAVGQGRMAMRTWWSAEPATHEVDTWSQLTRFRWGTNPNGLSYARVCGTLSLAGDGHGAWCPHWAA
jgi:hypothetical protein